MTRINCKDYQETWLLAKMELLICHTGGERCYDLCVMKKIEELRAAMKDG